MKTDQTTEAATLRQQAEERLQSRTPSSALPLSTYETGRLVHELQVHQIELEMQNEELREARAQMEAAVARYVDLYDFAPVGYLTLADSCEIVQANLAAATLLGVNRAALAGQSLLGFILPEDMEIYRHHRLQLLEADEAHACELRLLSAGGAPFWARLAATVMPEGAGGQQLSRIVISDISEHKWVEEAQTFLLRCGLPETGEDFFESLARYLSISLGMEYVCIDRLEGDGLTAQTVAVYNNGIFETNVRYALKDTPCGEVADKSVCCYPHGVQQLFPQDAALQELNAESYYGVTLLDSKGRPIGLIALIGHHVLDDPKRPELLLKLVAPRAAGELERRLAEEKLLKSDFLTCLCDFSEGTYPVKRIIFNAGKGFRHQLADRINTGKFLVALVCIKEKIINRLAGFIIHHTMIGNANRPFLKERPEGQLALPQLLLCQPPLQLASRAWRNQLQQQFRSFRVIQNMVADYGDQADRLPLRIQQCGTVVAFRL